MERRKFLAKGGIFTAAVLFSPGFILDSLSPSITKAEELSLPKTLNCPIHYWHEVNSSSQFEKYIGDLIRTDYFPVTLSKIAEYFKTGVQIWPQGKKPMAITFDDGLLSQYRNAEPVLDRWKIAATYAVMPNFWGDGVHKYMNNSQIREIATYRELASHTLSHHADLPQRRLIDQNSWRQEIVDSKYRLEDIVGKEVVSFVYPLGNYDRATANLVSQNYEIAVRTGGSTILTPEELFYLPRQAVS